MAATSSLPPDTKKLRACLLCSMLKTHRQFISDGCDNCDNILRLKGQPARVDECTSPNYEGVIAMINPDASWVSRYQKIEKFSKGLYAVKVSGRLPEDVEDTLEAEGVHYFPRDGTAGRDGEGE